MAVKVIDVISTVRGIIIDRIAEGIPPAFSDEEIVRAINMTVGGFFGARPEAFSAGSISTEPPAEIGLVEGSELNLSGSFKIVSRPGEALSGFSCNFKSTEGNCLLLLCDITKSYVVVDGTNQLVKASESFGRPLYADGTMEVSFDENKWKLFLSSDPSFESAESLSYLPPHSFSGGHAVEWRFEEAVAIFIDGAGIHIYSYEDAFVVTSKILSIYGSFLDGTSRAVSCSVENGKVTLKIGSQEASASMAEFASASTVKLIGGIETDGEPSCFVGSISDIAFFNSSGNKVTEYPANEGSGLTLADSIGDNDAEIMAESDSGVWENITQLSEELGILRWAVPQFCYGVAALLLEQRSKDAFYRKAADALHALYRGR